MSAAITKAKLEGSSFEDFLARHLDDRDKTGKKPLGWMADFHRAKEGVILDDNSDLDWRVLELAKETSWGNQNRDYVSHPNGQPMTQRDLTVLLGGVAFQRVNEAVDRLVERGFLQLEGRMIFVVDDPALARFERQHPKKANEKRIKILTGRILGEKKAKFLQFWEAKDPHGFQRYQILASEIEERDREQRGLAAPVWKDFLKEEAETPKGEEKADRDPDRSGQNERAEHEEFVRNGVDKTSGTSRILDEPILISLRSNKELASSLETLIRNAVQEAGLANLSGIFEKAIKNAAIRLGRVQPKEQTAVLEWFASDLQQIARRRTNRAKSWGIVVTAMEDAVDTIRTKAKQDSVATRHGPINVGVQEPAHQEPTRQEENQVHRSFLEAFPSHPDAASYRERLASLTSEKEVEVEKDQTQEQTSEQQHDATGNEDLKPSKKETTSQKVPGSLAEDLSPEQVEGWKRTAEHGKTTAQRKVAADILREFYERNPQPENTGLERKPVESEHGEQIEKAAEG